MSDLLEAEQIGTDAVLEDEHEQPVGGADREQVERDSSPATTTERKTTVSRTKRQAEHEGEHDGGRADHESK